MDDLINIIRFDYTVVPDYVIYTLLLQLYVLSTQIVLIFYKTNFMNQLKNQTFITKITSLIIFFMAGIYEEVLFRYDLISLFREFDLPHVAFITSFLFGFLHLFNIKFLGNSTKINVILVSNQFIFTTLLGYILYNIHNLKISMVVHIWFNITNYLIAIFISYLVKKTPDIHTDIDIDDDNMYKYMYNNISTTDNLPNYKKKVVVSNFKDIKIHESIKYMWNYNLSRKTFGLTKIDNLLVTSRHI